MTAEQVEGGKLFAIPYQLERGPLEKNTLLLDHMAVNTHWFAAGGSPEESRIHAMWMLTDSSLYKWEIWFGGTFAGMLLLSRVTPKVDALFHFTLLRGTGVSIFGARRLLWNFLGYAFNAFQLQRVSVEIPEKASKLAHFFRQRLAFKYEGELDLDRMRASPWFVKHECTGASTWIAAQGSRRERSHWDGTKWSDLILLRLTHTEYATRSALGDLPKATRENPSNGISDVIRREPSQVRAVDAQGDAPGLPSRPVQPPSIPTGSGWG